jgi:hypothetical protein
MTATVHALSKPPVPEVVEYLESALARAKAGEVNAILLVARDPDGVTYATAGIDDRWTVLGWLQYASHKLMVDR